MTRDYYETIDERGHDFEEAWGETIFCAIHLEKCPLWSVCWLVGGIDTGDAGNALYGVEKKAMNVEGSRHDEKAFSWHCWPAKKGMSLNEAREYFEKNLKPSTYTYETLRYDPHTGIVRTA